MAKDSGAERHEGTVQGAYTTIKGKMTCVAAPRKTSSMFAWSITEGLTTVGWGAPRKMAAGRRGAVAEALEADAGKMPTAPDPYFFGKQVLHSPHHLLHTVHLTSKTLCPSFLGKQILLPLQHLL